MRDPHGARPILTLDYPVTVSTDSVCTQSSLIHEGIFQLAQRGRERLPTSLNANMLIIPSSSPSHHHHCRSCECLVRQITHLCTPQRKHTGSGAITNHQTATVVRSLCRIRTVPYIYPHRCTYGVYGPVHVAGWAVGIQTPLPVRYTYLTGRGQQRPLSIRSPTALDPLL